MLTRGFKYSLCVKLCKNEGELRRRTKYGSVQKNKNIDTPTRVCNCPEPRS